MSKKFSENRKAANRGFYFAEEKGQLSNFYYEDLEELHLLKEQLFIDESHRLESPISTSE